MEAGEGMFSMEKIKVIIADDSDFVRDGMRIILDVDEDFVDGLIFVLNILGFEYE